MTNRRFQDWTRVTVDERSGVIVWDPTSHEWCVLFDDNGWESFDDSHNIKEAA